MCVPNKHTTFTFAETHKFRVTRLTCVSLETTLAGGIFVSNCSSKNTSCIKLNNAFQLPSKQMSHLPRDLYFKSNLLLELSDTSITRVIAKVMTVVSAVKLDYNRNWNSHEAVTRRR